MSFQLQDFCLPFGFCSYWQFFLSFLALLDRGFGRLFYFAIQADVNENPLSVNHSSAIILRSASASPSHQFQASIDEKSNTFSLVMISKSLFDAVLY